MKAQPQLRDYMILATSMITVVSVLVVNIKGIKTHETVEQCFKDC